MIELYQVCREVNQLLALIVCGVMGFRVVSSWRADWTRPHYVTHYRCLLVALLTYVVLTGVGAYQAVQFQSQAGPVSALYTIQTLVVFAICWRWPHPAILRNPEGTA